MPACFSPLQEAAAVPLTGCQKGGLWFWKGHQQDSCSLCGNPKDGNLDLVGGRVFFDSERFHLLPSHAAPCKDKGFSSSERWSLQEEIKLPDTKSDSLEQRLYLCFSRLLNMWMEVLEQQLSGWLGSLHLYLAMCKPVPTQHSSTGVPPGPRFRKTHDWNILAQEQRYGGKPHYQSQTLQPVFTSKTEAQTMLPTSTLNQKAKIPICISLCGTRERMKISHLMPSHTYYVSTRKESTMSLAWSAAVSLQKNKQNEQRGVNMLLGWERVARVSLWQSPGL